MSRRIVRWTVAVTVSAVLFAGVGESRADVKLHSLFNDDMVLQREMPVSVWGTADAGERVTVELGGRSVAAVADAEGGWTVKLASMKAGGPFVMTVTGKNTVKLANVLVGDVWLCGGQSNMAMSVGSSMNAAEESAAADHPKIRLFRVVNRTAAEPQTRVTGRWYVCTPQTVRSFTAVGYFFGRELQRDLDVPIGLIHSNWGGTPAQAWTSWKALSADDTLRKEIVEPAQKTSAEYPRKKEEYEASLLKWRVEAEKARTEGKAPPAAPRAPYGPESPHFPSALYNAMIHPLIPFGIKGAIWYQGESDASRAKQYQALLPVMIRCWRTGWNQGDFPFYIVQLANYMAVRPAPADTGWARLREAQTMTATNVPHCGIACIIDLGEEKDIHPRNKQEVGRRLALAALAETYGRKIVCSGPAFESMQVEGDRVRLKFRHVGSGLTTRTSDMPSASNQAKEGYRFTLGDGPLQGFAVADDDRKFVWAEARIEGDSVVVRSKDVAGPVAVRYAWADNPVCNLYNKEGLPALPFRTDDW